MTLDTAPAADPAKPANGPFWSSVTLFEDEYVRFELTQRSPVSETVAVTFDPIMVGALDDSYAGDFLRKAGADTLAVRKKSEHFYQPLALETFERVTREGLARYRRRIAYGSSLGAYAIAYYCRHGYDMVVSSSPRVSPHPRFGVDFWQCRVPFLHEALDLAKPATSRAVVFYDPRDALDRRLVEEGIAPAWPRARMLRVPYAGHPANQFLSETGFIAPYMRAVVAGVEPPVLNRRRKAQSATYHNVLAMGCLQHDKAAWALALAERSLAMNPQVVSAHRTRGLALMALQRDDESRQALASFLEFYPLDGEARNALKALGGAVPNVTAPHSGDAPAAAEPAPPGWAALLRRRIIGRR